MNRTKIEWTDISWNPLTGCDHGCWYCYAYKLFTRFHRSFTPTYYPERLKEIYNLKKPTERNNQHRKPWIAKAFPTNWLIFTCSVADLFASWTPKEWRDNILNTIWTCCTSHIYQLLTKNPEQIPSDEFPCNVWVGATVTNQQADYCNIDAVRKVKATVKFVSFEPLLAPLPRNVKLKGLDWIIIGKLTGSRKVRLDPQWVEDIVERADVCGIPVFLKDSLKWPDARREFPEVLPIQRKQADLDGMFKILG